MPFVRVDVQTGTTAEARQTISDVIDDAMRSTIDVPANDRFHLFSTSERIYDRSYLGIERSDGTIFIEITLRSGRAVEKKRAFYAAIANGLHERLGTRKEDVFIVLRENDLPDWSFGNGIAQYSPG
jgi:phenylpyruvate tautomerase PptA (4-oxalocrotonate tautomerase family)